MNSIFVTLNKVQTHLITWGEPLYCKGTDVIVCITGNPGITDMYTEFGTVLHERTKLPVCVVGHAGHEKVPDEQSNDLKDQEHLFNLEGQIQHKLDLIHKHIDKGSKLHLVGHSIGSWFIIELLQKNKKLNERISSVNLLFPTVQHMAQSKNGYFLNNIIRRIHIFILIITMLVHFIPETIQRVLVKIYLKFNSLPSHYGDRFLKFCHPKVVKNVLFLAYDEMDNVKELNCEVIEIIKAKTNVLYTSRDGWVPEHSMDDFQKFKPELQIKEINNIEHAFVIKSSETVAEMVSDFIITKS